ncbi:hypothetical protein F4604DRAFT_1125953 [Suillus subluteus]|nr:hypothetical protein F4604DRAFT_1125953 [Suillus subluteus]
MSDISQLILQVAHSFLENGVEMRSHFKSLSVSCMTAVTHGKFRGRCKMMLNRLSGRGNTSMHDLRSHNRGVLMTPRRADDFHFPTRGRATSGWGKLFRRSSSPSSVLIYAKALTSLYFTSHTSFRGSLVMWKVKMWQRFVRINGSKSPTVTHGTLPTPLGSNINLDDVPDDPLGWFLVLTSSLARPLRIPAAMVFEGGTIAICLHVMTAT